MITLTGTFEYDDSTPIDGHVILDLVLSNNQYITVGEAQEQGTETPVPHRYKIIITNGSIVSVTGLFPDSFASADTIHGNSEISPPDTMYKYSLFDAVGRQLEDSINVVIGTTPFDLFNAAPSIPDNAELSAIGVISNAPSGANKITNIYVSSAGKVVVEYDDVPI